MSADLICLSILIVFLTIAIYWMNKDYWCLVRAIRKHRSQKADDRCIEDDDKLYEALGDGIKCDRRVGNKDEMLKNCKRFIDNRCEEGYWPTYQQLLDMLRFHWKMKIKHLLNPCLGKDGRDFGKKCIKRAWCDSHNISEEIFDKIGIDDENK